MFFSFKTVGQLQVIYQPLSRPKQLRAGEYVVGRKIGLERVKAVRMGHHGVLTMQDHFPHFCALYVEACRYFLYSVVISSF
jgi:hypothetical protein